MPYRNNRVPLHGEVQAALQPQFNLSSYAPLCQR